MDELHTCDSSRYWLKRSYDERFSQGQEPEKFDKDCIRDFVNWRKSFKKFVILNLGL